MTSIRQHPMVAGTTETEGTVSYAISGTFGEFLGWTTIANGRKVRYVCRDGEQFEEGYGVVSSGPVLSRETILRTSENDTSKIDWGSGTRTIYPVPDIDTVFEADDGTFVKMLKFPQVESVDGGATTRRYRLWSDDGKMYLSDSTGSPFTHIWKYDAAAGTPTATSEVPVKSDVSLEAPIIKRSGTALGAAADLSVADTAAAKAGTSTTAAMVPARTKEALAHGPLLFDQNSQASAVTAAAQNLLIRANSGDGIERLTLQKLRDWLFAPDFVPSDYALTPDQRNNQAHGLGATPRRVDSTLACISADQGYSAGDEVDWGAVVPTGGTTPIATGRNATNLWVAMSGGIRVRDPVDGDGITGGLDLAKWRWRVRAWK